MSTLFETVTNIIKSSPINSSRLGTWTSGPHISITGKILEAVSHLPGDFLEVGGDRGQNTVTFLEIAKQQHRTVHVIDPWVIIEYPLDDFELGDRPAGIDVYKEYFCEAVKGYSNLETYRCMSESDEGKDAIKSMDLIFAFLDGGYLDWPRVTEVENPTRNHGKYCYAYPVATERLLEDFNNVSKQFSGPGIISIRNVEQAFPTYNWKTGKRETNHKRQGPIIDCIEEYMVDNTWKLVEVPYLYNNIYLIKS